MAVSNDDIIEAAKQIGVDGVSRTKDGEKEVQFVNPSELYRLAKEIKSDESRLRRGPFIKVGFSSRQF